MAQPEFELTPVDSCMLCGSSEQLPVKGVSWKGIAFSYSLCGACGLKFMNPRPTPESYQRFFTEFYWQQNLASEGFPTVEAYSEKQRDQMALRMPKYETAYRLLRNNLLEVTRLDSSTKVLEVGCAFGFSLEWLHRDFGCEVFGIEPSTEAVRRCQEAGCIEMVASTAEEYFCDRNGTPAEGEVYDVIFFRHCLETLLDPEPVLRGVRRMLKPSGVSLVYTANVFFYDAMSPFTPFLYSPETVRRLLGRAGLETFRVDALRAPRSKDEALRLPRPSYQMAAFARPMESPGPPLPTRVDPYEIIETISLGNACLVWHQLGLRDLAKLLSHRVWSRVINRLWSRSGS